MHIPEVDSTSISRVAIVGGRGAMGQLFAGRLAAASRAVTCLGRPLEGDVFETAIREADLVILSVPATALEATIKSVVPFMDGSILADLTSVKVQPMHLMEMHYSGPVIGTHPLFGPVIPEGFTPRVCVTPGEGIDPAPVTELMTELGFAPFVSTAREHDKGVAYVQGLNFISTVAHLAAMRQVENIEHFVTPSFERRLGSAKKMLVEDKELFETISEANPLLQETVRQFTGFLNIAASGDLDLLTDRAQWWWQNES